MNEDVSGRKASFVTGKVEAKRFELLSSRPITRRVALPLSYTPVFGFKCIVALTEQQLQVKNKLECLCKNPVKLDNPDWKMKIGDLKLSSFYANPASEWIEKSSHSHFPVSSFHFPMIPAG
jgi:hypothetical protein